MKPSFFKQVWRWASMTFAALALSVSAAAAQDQPFASWFKYDADIANAWTVEGDASRPLEVNIKKTKAGSGPTKRIMVLYPRSSSAYDTSISVILRVFANKDINAEFSIVNFDLDGKKGDAALRAAEQEKVDLIFAMGSESAAWLDQKYRGGKIPVVTVCSKDPVQLGQMKDYDSGSGSNFAFTSLNVPVDVQMAYLHDLRPQLKNIAILVDSKNISAMQTQAEPIANYAYSHGIHVIFGAVQDPNTARDELAKITHSAVQTMRKTDPELKESLFWVTGSTSVFREIKTINNFSENVPVVSAVPEIVTTGKDTAVLGIGISFESNARLAAIYGSQILDGKSPGTLKVGIVTPPDVAISFLKAREIGMKIPFSFFEIANFIYDYKGQVVRAVEDKPLTR